MEKERKTKLNKHAITQTNKENKGNENQNQKTKGKGTRILYHKNTKFLSLILTVSFSQSIHNQNKEVISKLETRRSRLEKALIKKILT